MRILVTGGAGYIGSHLVRELIKNHEIIVYDNLENGHKKSLPKNIKLIKEDLNNITELNKAFHYNNIDSVIHLASNIMVGESMRYPLKYYCDTRNSLNLLECMANNNVKKIIFSSSAAVYGQPEEIPIKENTKTNPMNPYGKQKLIFEKILEDCHKANGLKYISLRYFNAAGAHLSGEIGEDHNPETHLIPLVIKAALENKEIKIFGTDYATPDKTCIRDYIHVSDLAYAHKLALETLDKINGVFNLGNNKGYSVREIIEKTREITNIDIKTLEEERRKGDPAILIASYEKIKKELGWEPKHNINIIIETAWNWHKNNQQGYKR